ncbi:hypothetical protein LPJ66_006190 [Kickxella alabastrina]|uniref:Uncharacterized protein n=1 Tax=Kickxella alabastrina TaxID=61397 RepID=A0ACC1IDT6_9FUNG|nr:hypothetical protein LPJ66_006190 [Kickxella alabastrina]
MLSNTTDVEAKRVQGLKHKDAGNDFFKGSDFTGALREYYYALLHLRGLNSNVMDLSRPTDPNTLEESGVTSLDKDLSVINSNMAACHLRLERIPRVIECAQAALKANPFNTKAKFRLAQGYVREGSLEKARKILDELEKNAPMDRAFANERKHIVEMEKKADQKQRETLAGMFDRAKN